MENQIPSTPDAAQLAIFQKKLSLNNKIRSGINWFYWIAGLSLLNTFIYLTGSKITFVIGLGATQFVDGFMAASAKDLGGRSNILTFIGLALDICIAGVFVLLGFLGRKRFRWPIIIGMVLYVIDGMILLLFKDFLGAAFHVWAFIGIWGGLKSIIELGNLEKSVTSSKIEGVSQEMPS